MEQISRSQLQKRLRAKEQRNLCFYCQLRMDYEDMTWEHLVSRSHGGSEKLCNKRVAHNKCNVMIGNLPVQIKLILHDVGVKLGSDAFFLTTADMVRLPPCTLALAGIKRRAKRLSKRELKSIPPEITKILYRTNQYVQATSGVQNKVSFH